MNRELVRVRLGNRGFTLLELVIALAVVAILIRIAFPSFQAYIVRGSRQTAQSELVTLANAQERIFLNSSAYATNVTAKERKSIRVTTT